MSALLVFILTFIFQVEVKKQATKKRMYLKIVVNQHWNDKSSRHSIHSYGGKLSRIKGSASKKNTLIWTFAQTFVIKQLSNRHQVIHTVKIHQDLRAYTSFHIIYKQCRISLYILTGKQATDGTSSYLRSELSLLSARQEK